MNPHTSLKLLGGLTPQAFMQRYWHKKPLLIRQAIPGFEPLVRRTRLLDLATQPHVQSRLIQREHTPNGSSWNVRHGPFKRRSFPPFKQSGWTLLLQGMDLHDERVHTLMQQFRFIPDARLDDLMISYASDGGGVGPHFDSYDVFLLQAWGRRCWRIGRQKDAQLVPDAPLKVLAHFEAEQEFVLDPGDMLYLPPRYAHDGIAQGECMTYSIGFRSPVASELAREILVRLSEQATQDAKEQLYRDPHQEAVTEAGAVPKGMLEFANAAVAQALRDPRALERALGEYLSEPKADVWFESGESTCIDAGVRLDRRTRMVYDVHHVFINGESFLASGRDARLMRALANQRQLRSPQIAQLSKPARELLADWCSAGWLHTHASFS